MISDTDLSTLKVKVDKLTASAAASTSAASAAATAASAADAAVSASTSAKLSAASAAALVDSDVADLKEFIDGINVPVPSPQPATSPSDEPVRVTSSAARGVR